MTLLTRALITGALPPHRKPMRPPHVIPDEMLRTSLRDALAGHRAGEPLRVFGYGALMWERQATEGAPAEPARLIGFARRWCLRDIHNRGVPEAPGLTLGLEPVPEEACEGLLFTLPGEEALWPVWTHEMPPGFYRPGWVTVAPLRGGAAVRALTFIADAAHPLYAGALAEPAQAQVLATAVGPQGTNAGYLLSALEILRAKDLRAPLLERLEGMVAARLRA